MSSPVNTTLDVLLTAAEAKLVADNVVTSSNCFITVKPDVIMFPPGTYVVISPGKQVVDDHIRVGAGRDVVVIDGQMTVSIWTAVALDQSPRDDQFLTKSSLGAIVLTTSVINSLELYQPVDESGNQLMPMGFELISIDTYSREVQGVGWGQIKTLWKLEYTLNIANAPTP
jgi:hypothetical protein